MNRGANKTVRVGNRLDQGGVGGGKYVKGEQEQIYNLLRRRSRFIQLAPLDNAICKIGQQIAKRSVQSKYLILYVSDIDIDFLF